MPKFLNTVPRKFQRSFQVCIDMAKQNPDQFKFCCITLNKSGHITAMSFQSNKKSHPLQYHFAKKANKIEKIYLHAEISALIKAPPDPYAMLVVRVDLNGNLVNSKPCTICQLAISEASSLRHCYYTDNNHFFDLFT